MNLFTLFSTCCVLLLTAFTHAQSFEGRLIYEAEEGTGMNAVLYVKGDHLRVETTTAKGPLVRLINRHNGAVYNLVEKDGRKTAIKMQRDNKFARESLQQRAVSEAARVERTDETKELYGYTCRKVTAQDGRTEGMAWVVEGVDLPLDDLLVNSSAYNAEPSPVHAALLGAGWIMELQEIDLQTRAVSTTKLRLFPEVLEQALFDVPADYTIVDATDMRGLLRSRH